MVKNQYFLDMFSVSINNDYFDEIINDIVEHCNDDCYGILALKEIAQDFSAQKKYLSQTLSINDNTDKLFSIDKWVNEYERGIDTQQDIYGIMTIADDGCIYVYPATNTQYYANIILNDNDIYGDISRLPTDIQNKITHVYVEVFGK